MRQPVPEEDVREPPDLQPAVSRRGEHLLRGLRPAALPTWPGVLQPAEPRYLHPRDPLRHALLQHQRQDVPGRGEGLRLGGLQPRLRDLVSGGVCVRRPSVRRRLSPPVCISVCPTVCLYFCLSFCQSPSLPLSLLLLLIIIIIIDVVLSISFCHNISL